MTNNNIDRRIVLIWVAFLTWVANGLFIDVRSALLHPESTDVSAYIAAARIKADEGAGIHDLDKLHAAGRRAGVTGEARSYLYPPPFAELLVGTAGVDFIKLRVAWIAATYASVVVLFGFLIQLTSRHGVSPLLASLVTFGLIVAFSPIQREIFYGQASIFCATLTVLAMWLDKRSRAVLSGVAAGVATIIKIYPGVVLAGYLLNRRWTAFSAGVVAMILIAAASIASYGIADWLSFIRVHLAEGASAGILYADPSRGYLEAPNYSLTQVLYLLAHSLGLEWSPAALGHFSRIALFAGGIAFLLAFRKELAATRSLLAWCHAIFLFFLPSSIVFWNHVFVFYLPGLVLTGAVLLEQPRGLTAPFILWTAGAAAMAVADFGPNLGILNSGMLLVLKPVKFYGLVIHAVAFAWMLKAGMLAARTQPETVAS